MFLCSIDVHGQLQVNKGNAVSGLTDALLSLAHLFSISSCFSKVDPLPQVAYNIC